MLMYLFGSTENPPWIQEYHTPVSTEKYVTLLKSPLTLGGVKGLQERIVQRIQSSTNSKLYFKECLSSIITSSKEFEVP